MAEEPHSDKTGSKHPKKRARPVRKSSGGGAIQMVVGLLLALVIFGVIYVVMQKGGMGNYEYWSEYQRVVPDMRRDDLMNPDEVWKKVHSLPRQKITDPTLLQLHDTWVEYANAIRDSADFTKRGAEIESRIRNLESQMLKKLGATEKKP